MACTITPTGSCSVAPDSYGAIDAKTDAALNAIGDVFIQGYDDYLVFTWDTVDDPTYTVNLMYRVEGSNEWIERVILAKTVGTYTTPTLVAESLVNLYIRPETATTQGEWQRYECIVNSQWSSETKDAYFGEQSVVFGVEELSVIVG